MALETLKNIKEIDGFQVERFPYEQFLGTEEFINIDDELNIVSFQLQDGPVKENGVNGCQVNTLIEASILIIEGLNEKFSCAENRFALQHLRDALNYLEMRNRDRIDRGAEGTDQV